MNLFFGQNVPPICRILFTGKKFTKILESVRIYANTAVIMLTIETAPSPRVNANGIGRI